MSLAADIRSLFPDGLCGIIYDCDGVMIDSAAANRHLYNTILQALGLPALTPAQERFAFQATFQQALDKLVPAEIQPDIEAAIARNIDYDRDILTKINLMPGYRKFIAAARAKGMKQAVDTNRTAPGIHKVLKRFEISVFFDPVISTSSVREPKPSPEGPKMILENWAINPWQALFVGDSPDDREAACGAGMVFAAFGGHKDLHGDLAASSWSELADMLWNEK